MHFGKNATVTVVISRLIEHFSSSLTKRIGKFSVIKHIEQIALGDHKYVACSQFFVYVWFALL